MSEYFYNTLERCEFDVTNVKNDIILHGYDADRCNFSSKSKKAP